MKSNFCNNKAQYMNDLKFNIEKILNKFPYDRRDSVLKELESSTGLSYERLYVIRKMKVTDKGEAKLKHLITIAKCRNVTLEDLINEQFKEVC